MHSQSVVAVIGASRQRAKYGNRAVRAYRAEGWKVYPIHLEAKEIEGIPALPSILDVPESVDRASVYLPPDRVLDVLPAIAQKGVREVYLNPGSESSEVIQAAQQLDLAIILACSIVEIGRSPSRPD